MLETKYVSTYPKPVAAKAIEKRQDHARYNHDSRKSHLISASPAYDSQVN